MVLLRVADRHCRRLARRSVCGTGAAQRGRGTAGWPNHARTSRSASRHGWCRAFVQQFSAEGFRVCGSYRFHTGGRPVVMTVRAGPRSDRVAVVTDKVLYVASRFGRRSVVTTNSAAAPLPADVLRQHVAGGPVELVRAHDAALTLLDRHSIHPDVFASDAEALQTVREMEERALAFIRGCRCGPRCEWRRKARRERVCLATMITCAAYRLVDQSVASGAWIELIDECPRDGKRGPPRGRIFMGSPRLPRKTSCSSSIGAPGSHV